MESSGRYFSAASEASLAFSTSSLHLPSEQNSARSNFGATLKAAAAVSKSLLVKNVPLRTVSRAIFNRSEPTKLGQRKLKKYILICGLDSLTEKSWTTVVSLDATG